MNYKVSLKQLFQYQHDRFTKDYGSDLFAYSYCDNSVDEWFNQFRNAIANSIGSHYLPVYRMADGEFHFLFGSAFNKNHPKLWKHAIAFVVSKVKEMLLGPSINNSWGETYSAQEIKHLKDKYEDGLLEILKNGMLCPFLYENPEDAYTHYNKKVLNYFRTLPLSNENIFPFHFPMFALTNPGWETFVKNRRILIITGNIEQKRTPIERTLQSLGAAAVGFFEISATGAMKDKVDQSKIESLGKHDLVLIAGGIGSLNIISQMNWFKGPVIDIGGLIKVFYETGFVYHGGAVKFPVSV